MKRFLATFLFTSLIASFASAQLVVNSGFEQGLTGWTLQNGSISDSGVVAYSAYFISDTVQYGHQVARFNASNFSPAATLSQLLSTQSGQSYTLSFAFGNWGTSAGSGVTQRLLVQMKDVASSLNVLSTTVSDPSAATTITDLYTQFQFKFTATGQQTLLSFTDQAIGTNSSDGLLDNVQVAVPETAIWIQLLPFVLILAFVRSNRSTQTTE